MDSECSEKQGTHSGQCRHCQGGAFSFLALRIYTEGHDGERPLTRGPSHFALFSLVSSVRSRPRLDMSSLLLGVLLLVCPLLGLCDSDGSASSPWSRTTTTTTTRPSQVPPSDHRGGHEAVQHEIPFVGCGVLYFLAFRWYVMSAPCDACLFCCACRVLAHTVLLLY